MSASIMRAKMQQGAHTGMQFTLEAAHQQASATLVCDAGRAGQIVGDDQGPARHLQVT